MGNDNQIHGERCSRGDNEERYSRQYEEYEVVVRKESSRMKSQKFSYAPSTKAIDGENNCSPYALHAWRSLEV